MSEKEVLFSVTELLKELPSTILVGLVFYLIRANISRRHWDSIEADRLANEPENLVSPEHYRENLGAFAMAFKEEINPESGEKQLYVLLVQRHRPAGLWNLPGGAVETGETVFAAAIRELREETGLEGEVLRGTATKRFNLHIDKDSPIPGERRPDRFVVMVVKIVGGEITLNEEAADIKWWPVDDLPENIYGRHLGAIHEYAEDWLDTRKLSQAMRQSILQSKRFFEGKTVRTEAQNIMHTIRNAFAP